MSLEESQWVTGRQSSEQHVRVEVRQKGQHGGLGGLKIYSKGTPGHKLTAEKSFKP